MPTKSIIVTGCAPGQWEKPTFALVVARQGHRVFATTQSTLRLAEYLFHVFIIYAFFI